MKVICDSAEHHFLTTLEKLKKNPKGWIALHFSLSKHYDPSNLLMEGEEIHDEISSLREQTEAFFEQYAGHAKVVKKGFIYLFADNDVVMLGYIGDEQDKQNIQMIYDAMAVQLEPGLSEKGLLVNELYNYQKLVDQKLITARRFEAYKLMGDKNRIASIPARRERREETVVLVVEDDRFTAAYTSGILNKEFEVIVCRDGEEAISAYIEYAPDIVLLDIHLPGLSGHEALQAIRAVDPHAFVVMLSVDTVKDSIRKASEFGAKSFIKKPFSKERLMHTIKASPYVRGIYAVDSGSVH